MEYPLEQYPCIPVRSLPSNYDEISNFYHDLNSRACDIYCAHLNCPGHMNKLDLNYRMKNGKLFATCKVCRRSVQFIPGNSILEVLHSYK